MIIDKYLPINDQYNIATALRVLLHLYQYLPGLHKVMTFIHKSQSHDFYDFNDFIDFNNTFDFYEFYNFDGLNIYFYYDIVIYTVYVYTRI